MTQHERALQGLLFDARCQELRDLKHKAHKLCRKFNTMDEYDPERQPIVREFIGAIGENYYFQGPIQFNYGCHTRIGDHFFCNFNLTVMDDGPITIGEHVMIGPNVSLMATSHPLLYPERETIRYPDGHISTSEYAPPIVIGNHVWIACNVVICGGVTIGDGAVIGAGSVVTRDIPAGYLACGVPCRPLRPITEADTMADVLEQPYFDR